MIIIGMTGPIGHGKSTLAKALQKLEPSSIHFESSMIIAEVANALHAALREIPSRDDIDSINQWLRPLPAILLETTHTKVAFKDLTLSLQDTELHPIEYEKLLLHLENLKREPKLAKQEITQKNKEAYRPILQWLGGYIPQKTNPNVWYKEIMRRAQAPANNSHKLCVIGGLRYPEDARQVRQAGGKIIKVYRPGHLQYDMLDPTERERDNVIPDATVVSNGSIDDLDNCARVILKDIETGQLQKTYYATGHGA